MLEAISTASNDNIDNLAITTKGTKIVSNNDTLGKDAFLQLMVAQMKNQDPFNTQDPSQYVEQMATLSSLEQLTNISENMEYLVSLNSGVLLNSALSTTSNLLDKNVEVGVLNSENNIEKYTGKILSTFIKDNEIYMELELDSGTKKEVPYASLIKVQN